jgi:HPt (histidine-containing phosphotransfer) domain-containing protein
MSDTLSLLAHTTSPAIDSAYLDDMQTWLGDEAMNDLLATAPDILRQLAVETAAACAAGDMVETREGIHRLAGAGASVGAKRLADFARACLQASDEALNTATMQALQTATEEALAALIPFCKSSP